MCFLHNNGKVTHLPGTNPDPSVRLDRRQLMAQKGQLQRAAIDVKAPVVGPQFAGAMAARAGDIPTAMQAYSLSAPSRASGGSRRGRGRGR